MADLILAFMNVLHLIEVGGGFILPLIVCSLVTMAIVFEQWWYSFLAARRIKRLHNEPQAWNEVHGMDMISRMAGVLRRNQNAAEEIQKREMEQVYNHFERRLSWLNTLAAIAPLLGLLGTVAGMIRIFTVVSQSKPENPLASLSGGISEALFATGGGLMVAIVAAFFYHYLSTRLEAQSEEMALWYYENRRKLNA